jgi:hypothetical protein
MGSFYIGCYWMDRKEDADACATRMLACLKGLAGCDAVFEDVFATAKRKPPYRISLEIGAIKPVLERGRNREDLPPFRVIEKLGFSGSFASDWKTARNEEWVLRFFCGAYPNTPHLMNSCILRLPSEGEAVSRLLQSGTMVSMMRVLISAWDPDWAVVQSDEFRDLIAPNVRVPGRVLAGWMTYFAPRVGRLPDGVPVHSRIEIPDRGTLLILTEDAVAPDRPDHVAKAHAVSFALQGAGLIPEEACQVQ